MNTNDNNIFLAAPASVHYDDVEKSFKRKMRLSCYVTDNDYCNNIKK